MTSLLSPARFVGGNWKMNLDLNGAILLARDVRAQVEAIPASARPRVDVFVPFPYLLAVREALDSTAQREGVRGGSLGLGAQDVYFEPSGAFTGEVSIAMLRDCGVASVLVGHSERRHVIGETDEIIARKVRAAIDGGIHVVLCVGETLRQREAGETDRVNERQIRTALAGVSVDHMSGGAVTIAYEPVWAIGTGKTATPADAQDAHAKIRSVLASMFGQPVAAGVTIQYGGSVKAGNAAELFSQPDIDGGLIGGASLKADEFMAIVKAAAPRKSL
jgi:triosephosphate isomerase (TIM)